MPKFKLTLIRIPRKNIMLNFAQKELFNTLSRYIFADSDTPYSKQTKKERDDPYKVLVIEDTLEECNKAMNQWKQMKFTKFDSIKQSLLKSKVFRVLPFRNRMKLKTNKDDSSYYIKFQQFLIAIGISIDVEVIQ